MYFPDRGCVRPLRHLYGYTTVCLVCLCRVTDSASVFYVRERGSCRCVRGEVVCAKSPFKMIPKEGETHTHTHSACLRVISVR